MDEPLPFEEVGRKPRTRSKRRSSILKPSSGPPLQDLDLNVKAPENGDARAAKVKSRRVSFSRSNQIKEFQTGSQTLTIWNSTYEEDQSQNQSAQQQQQRLQRAGAQQQQRGGVPRPAGLPAQQRGRIVAGQTASVSPSKKTPLQISIPPKSDSPKKFLPTDPVVDTTNFLQSLAGGSEEEVNSGAFLQSLGGGVGEEGANESVDQENSFLAMLNQLEGPVKTAVNTKENRGKPRGEVLASHSRTIVGQVDMSRTLVGEDLDLSDDDDDEESMVDAGGFLAALAGPSSNATVFDGGMDMTGALNMTCMDAGVETTCHDGGMNMTCRDGGMEMTCQGGGMEMTCQGGGMEMTCQGVELNMTCRGENSELDITCPDKNESVGSEIAYKHMEITSNDVFEPVNDNRAGVENYHRTLAKNLEQDLPGSEGSSRNSSFDGGATATMPFSGLALANNTLMLPRKESEEDDDDMTKVPIQIINYDPLRPVEGLVRKQLPSNQVMPRSIMANQDRTNAEPSNMEMTQAGHLAGKEEYNSADMYLTKVDGTKVGSTDMELTGAVQRTGIAGSFDMELTRAGQQYSTRLETADMEQTLIAHQNGTGTTHSDMELTKAAQSNETKVGTTEMEITRAAYQNRTRMGSTDMELTQAQRNSTSVGSSNMDLTRTAQNGTRMINTDMELTRAAEQSRNKVEEHRDPKPHFNFSEVEFTEAVPRGLVPQAVGDITSFIPKGDYESTRRLDFVIPKPIEIQRPVETTPDDIEFTEAVPKQMVPQDIGDITSFVPRGECESTRRVDLFIPKPGQEPEDDLDMDDSMMAEFQQCVKGSKEVPNANTTKTASAEMELTAHQEGSSKIEEPTLIGEPNKVPEMNSGEAMEIVMELSQAGSTKNSTPGRNCTGAFKMDYDPPQLITPNHDPIEMANVPPTSPTTLRQSRSSDGDLLRARFPSPTPDYISPERTEMVGGLGQMPRFNKSAFQGDVTSFSPRDTYESTRCVGDILPKAVMDVTSFAPKNDYESTRRIQDLMPQAIGDITSFAPKFGEYESTRRINAIIPTATASREIERKNSDDVDMMDMMEEFQQHVKQQADSSHFSQVEVTHPEEEIEHLERREPEVDVTQPIDVTHPEEVVLTNETQQKSEMQGVNMSAVHRESICRSNTSGSNKTQNCSSPKRCSMHQEELESSPKRIHLNSSTDDKENRKENNESVPDSQEEIRKIIANCQIAEVNESVDKIEQSQNHKSLNKTSSIRERLRGLSCSFAAGQERNENIDQIEEKNDEIIDPINASSAMELTKINGTNVAMQMTRVDITRVPTPDVDITQTSPVPDVDITRTSPVPDVDITKTYPVPDVDITQTSPVPDVDITKTSFVVPVCHGTPAVDISKASSVPDVDITRTSSVPDLDITQTSPVKHLYIPQTSPVKHIDITQTSSVVPVSVPGLSPSKDILSPLDSDSEGKDLREPLSDASEQELESPRTDPAVEASTLASKPNEATETSPGINLAEASNVQKSQNVVSELCLSSSIFSPLRSPSEGSSLFAASVASSNTSSVPSQMATISNSSASSNMVDVPNVSSNMVYVPNATSVSHAVSTSSTTSKIIDTSGIVILDTPHSADVASAPSEKVGISNSEPVATIPSQMVDISLPSSNSASVPSSPSHSAVVPSSGTDLDDPEISFRSLNAEAKNLSSQFKNLSQGIVDENSQPETEMTSPTRNMEDNLPSNIISSNPTYLISEATAIEPQPKVDKSITRKRQSTEPNCTEDAKSSKTDNVSMEYPEENETPKIIVTPPLSPESASQIPNPIKVVNKGQKMRSRSKSPPRLPEVTIFQDLASKKVPKEVVDSDDEDDNDWRLEMHDEESKTAVFSWMKRSLWLVLNLGPKLEPKKSRKSIGKLVIHYPITKIYLDTLHNINGQDYPGKSVPDLNRDLAQFSVIRKFTASALHSLCPNTYSLSSVLKNISQYVTPANQFMDALDTVDDNHFPFKITNNVVTVGFVSTSLELAFDLTVDFNGGFSTAPERVSVKAVIGEPKISCIEKLARMAQPGPLFIQEVASKIGQYVKEKEKAAAKKQSNN